MGARMYIAAMHVYAGILMFVAESRAPHGGVRPLMVLSYRFRSSNYRKHSNDNTETLDTVSNTNVNASGGTKSFAFLVENGHQTPKTVHSTIDFRSRYRINPRPALFVSGKASECR